MKWPALFLSWLLVRPARAQLLPSEEVATSAATPAKDGICPSKFTETAGLQIAFAYGLVGFSLTSLPSVSMRNRRFPRVTQARYWRLPEEKSM